VFLSSWLEFLLSNEYKKCGKLEKIPQTLYSE